MGVVLGTNRLALAMVGRQRDGLRGGVLDPLAVEGGTRPVRAADQRFDALGLDRRQTLQSARRQDRHHDDVVALWLADHLDSQRGDLPDLVAPVGVPAGSRRRLAVLVEQ